jgi:hypothetical protein
MKALIFSVVLAASFSLSSSAQTSWLDKPMDRNWNDGKGVVPAAPRSLGPIDPMCKSQIRPAESVADKALTRAGWHLYGAAQTYGNVTLITAMADADGMCRPNEYNAFVFVADRFAGTLSPTRSMARSDGSINDVRLTDRTRIIAEFARYGDSDALCCPSRKTYVEYSITTGTNPVLKVDDTWTEKLCEPGKSN